MPYRGPGTAMREFYAGNLHSGKGGPVVKSAAQAKAIEVSMQKKHGDYGKKKKTRRIHPMVSALKK